MSNRSTITRGFSAATVASALVLGLAACGSDSVDNSSDDSTGSAAVPSVSSSAQPSDEEKSADKSAEKSSEAASDKPRSDPAPEDGAVEQVDEVPTSEGHSEEDQKYLDALKDKGIDLSKTDEQQSGLEDSLIAAGTSYCRSQENDQQDVLLPLAAGQLQTMGVVDGDPRETEKVLVDAAKSAYCQ